MEEIEKEIKKVAEKILKSFPDLKEKIKPESYHFIEICIIFSEYCDDLTISKEDFIAANKIFADDEDSEDINNSKEEIFTKIFNFLSGDKEKDTTNNSTIPLYVLYGYLKIISINDKINNEILFKILDRKEKGNIDFENAETLISNLEDFLDIKEDWNDFIESYKGKKLTPRNLNQGDFSSKIKKLFYLAEVKVFDLAKKSFEANEPNKSKSNNNDNTENNKNEENNFNININLNNNNFNNKANSRQSSSNISSSKAISRKSEKGEDNTLNNINNEKQLKLNLQDDEHSINNENNNKNNNQAIVPYDSSRNMNINNNSNGIGINLDEANFDESLFEKIFDKRKEIKIHQIKNSSLLYDINLDEFLHEFKKYEKDFFDKNKFISVFCEIIQAHTSEVFKGPMLRYSLSLLFQIIDIEKKNKISYYEILGPIAMLTKAKTEERLNLIFSYEPPELISIICGILCLYLNTEIIKDFNILSEIFIKACYQMNIKKSQNFLEWIFGNKGEENLEKNFDFLIEEENTENSDDENLVNGKVINKLNNIFLKSNFFGINNFSIIDVTNKIMFKYSLLGQMNFNHVNSLVDDLLNEKYETQKTKEKNRYKQEFLFFLEKFLNFTKNELIDMTLIHALFILIFSGSSLDKVRSIFIIHDLKETETIKINDFRLYLKNMYYFMLKEIDFEENINLNELVNDLAKNICDNLSRGRESICFGDIADFFDNVDFDIPS